MSGLGRTGGYAPGPSRTGGAYPLLRRVMESLETGQGSAWSTTTGTAAWVENMATARVIAFDLYEAGQRMANNFLPQCTSAAGLLPRWEAIFSLYPAATDTESTRRTALTTAWAKLSKKNRPQEIADALRTALGPVFVDVTPPPTPANANVWWPAGATTDLPIANTATATIPWYSSVCLVSVQVEVPPSWTLAQFYAAVAKIGPILDPLIRAWETWQWWAVDSVQGTKGFYLDTTSTAGEPNNLDVDVFDV